MTRSKASAAQRESLTLFYAEYPIPMGTLTLVASDRGLRASLLNRMKSESKAAAVQDPAHPILVKAWKQFQEYFDGRRTRFDLPLDPIGTPFQQKVWKALQTIPYGKTICYQEQAVLLGTPKAMRAVGAANGKNKLAIVIPCHRVVGKSGKLTGFAAGLNVKQELLELERGQQA